MQLIWIIMAITVPLTTAEEGISLTTQSSPADHTSDVLTNSFSADSTDVSNVSTTPDFIITELITFKPLFAEVTLAQHFFFIDTPFHKAIDQFPDFPSQIAAAESEFCGTSCDMSYRYARHFRRADCEKCRCDKNCFTYSDCCPDKSLLSNNTEENIYKCEQASFNNYSQWYYMIRSCPANTSTDLVDKCLSRDVFKWELQVLVTDLKTGDVYRNTYCAQCNHVQTSATWNTSVECTSRSDAFQNAKTSYDAYRAAIESPTCGVWFYPQPVTPFLHRTCGKRADSLISSCNVTGKWTYFDPRVVTACESFTRVVLNKYKNIFCYYCNEDYNWDSVMNMKDGGDNLGVNDVPITALLNFGGHQPEWRVADAPEEMSKASRCAPDQVYDETNVRCRTILCSTGKTFNGSECINIYKLTNMYGYKICLHIRVDFQTPLSNFSDYEQTFDDVIVGITDTLYRPLSSYIWFDTIGHMYIFQNCTTGPIFLLHHVSFSVYSTTYPIETTTFSKQLHDRVHEFVKNSGYNIYVEFSQKCVDFSHMSILYCYTSIEQTLWLRGHGNRIMSGTENLVRQMQYLSFNNLLVCPYIRLSPAEFYLKVTPESIKDLFPSMSSSPVDLYKSEYYTFVLNRTGANLSHDKYILQEDLSALICVKDFMNLTNVSYQVETIGNEPRRRVSLTNTTKAAYDRALVVISVVFSCLSLFFLAVTFIIYCLIHSMRTPSGVMNMGLIVTLFLAQSLYEFGIEQNEHKVGCIVIAILIHILWLSVLFWMNACTTFMFMKLTFPLKWIMKTSVKKTLFLSSMYSILVPSLIVGINITVHYLITRDIGYGGSICYIGTREGNIYAFGVPIAVVVVTNVCLYVYTIIDLKRKPNLVQKNKESKINLTACVLLSSITGISWVFGYIYEATKVLTFGYIFTIMIGGQGIFLFFTFILNRHVAGLCCKHIKKQRKRTAYSTSQSSNQTSALGSQKSKLSTKL